MKQRKPEYHPVDAFFQRQAEKIPVDYDPRQWEILSAILDQDPSGQKPTPGQAGPPDPPSAGPAKWRRGIWPAACFLALMQLLPSASPQGRLLATQPAGPAVSSRPSMPAPAEPAALPTPEPAAPQRPAAPPTLSAPAAGYAQEAPQPAAQPAADAPAEASLSESKSDSLMLMTPPLIPAPDSLAEKRKAKRKHLFW